jgi:hypothetical protein
MPRDAAAFYSPLLDPEEQQLLAAACTTAELHDEIALVRARIGRLAKATSSPSARPEDARALARMLDVLTRMAAVQSRKPVLDTALPELNEYLRRQLDQPDGLAEAFAPNAAL